MNYIGRIIGVFLPFVFNVFYIYYTDVISFSTVSIYLLFILNGIVGFFFGLQFDKYRDSRKELKNSKLSLKEYGYALKASMDGVAIFNDRGEYQFFNQSFLDTLGYEGKELLGKPWNGGFHDEEYRQLEREITETLNISGYWHGELVGVRKDGTTFPIEVTLTKIKETQGFVCILRDITDKKDTEKYIEHWATHNDLTNLPNRRLLLQQLHTSIEEGRKFAVLFLDLDRFKLTNDTLGHSIGDLLLQEVANRLLTFQSDSRSIYHLGGDEFIVVVHGYSKEAISDLAESLIEAIAKLYVIQEFEVYITTSIGISFYPENSNSHDEIIALADTAMYNAKLKGKNTYQLYTSEINEQLQRKMKIERELRYAIDKNELYLNYQPKIDLEKNTVIGMEALLRWNNPNFGFISPLEFIPIAEETGLINPIGKWVIQQSIDQLKQWKQKGYRDIKVSVNLSLIQLRQHQFVDMLSETIRESGVDPTLFELEITESLMENVGEIVPTLEKIKQLGVGISIDDFGTGFSSLSYLKSLPIDTVKIDKSFIIDIVHNSSDIALVKSILDIGTNLQLSVVAEGIETEEHLRLLKDFGCPIGQGYYFSPPISAEKFEALYLTQKQ